MNFNTRNLIQVPVCKVGLFFVLLTRLQLASIEKIRVEVQTAQLVRKTHAC